MMEFAVFWVVPCSVVVGYQHFRGLCSLRLQGSALVSNHHTTQCNNPENHKFHLHCCENLKSHEIYDVIKTEICKTFHCAVIR
jgi:hypothetical protein